MEAVLLEDKLDRDFKPGLYRQTEAFWKQDSTCFCTLKEQARSMLSYMQKWQDTKNVKASLTLNSTRINQSYP